ncbi:MAG: hypothetical protein ACRCTZ_03390 [Sarcina sp.]
MIKNTYTSKFNLKNIKSLPTNMYYFFEDDFIEIITLNSNKHLIDAITSVSAFIEIIDYKLQKYTKSNSYNGFFLPTNKLIVELNLSKHIKYIGKDETLISSMINLDDSQKIISIGIPNKICNVPIEDIIRRGEFTITPYIEHTFFKKINSKKFLISISILVNIKF